MRYLSVILQYLKATLRDLHRSYREFFNGK